MSAERDIEMPDGALGGGLHKRGPCPACRGLAGPHDLKPGLVTVPGAPLARAVAGALMSAGAGARALEGGWRRGRDGRLTYEYVGRAGGRIEVTLGGAGGDWSEIEAISALTLDVFIAVLARMSDPESLPLTAAPNRRGLPFCAAWPIRLKGYARYGDERRAFEWQLGAELGVLLGLRARVFGYPGWVDGSETRLIEAVADPELSGGPAVRLRFGDWAGRWLNLRGDVRTALLPGEVYGFDHRANRGSDVLAKKLGLYSTLQWGRAGGVERLVRPVRSVLRQIGELPADVGSRSVRTGRLADRFDEALLRLAEIGSFGVRYRRIDRSEAVVARGRGWTSAWLAEELVFDRPSWLSDPNAQPSVLA